MGNVGRSKRLMVSRLKVKKEEEKNVKECKDDEEELKCREKK